MWAKSTVPIAYDSSLDHSYPRKFKARSAVHASCSNAVSSIVAMCEQLIASMSPYDGKARVSARKEMYGIECSTRRNENGETRFMNLPILFDSSSV